MSPDTDSIFKFFNISITTLVYSPSSRKRPRVESSPSPRPSPKRTTRDQSPADSDGYNSPEDKSERPIGRGQAKLHSQPLLPSPVCPTSSESREILFKRTHSCLMGNALLIKFKCTLCLRECTVSYLNDHTVSLLNCLGYVFDFTHSSIDYPMYHYF